MFSNGKIKHFKGIVHTKIKILILSEMKVSVVLLPVLLKNIFCILQKTITPNDDRIIDYYYYYYPFKLTVQCFFFNEIDLVVKMCFLK